MLSIVKVAITVFILFASFVTSKRSGNLRGRVPLSNDYNSKSVIVSFNAACHLDVDQKISILEQLFPCIQRRGIKHTLDTGSFIVLDIVGDDSCLDNTEIDLDEYCITDVEYESVYNITGCSSQNLQSGMPYGYSWSLDKLDKTVDNLYYHMDSSSSVVDLYILDTGVQLNHVEFSGRVTNMDTTYPNITGSHATHVAGIAGGNNYGVSRGLKIYSYNVCRYFYSDGSVGCAGGDIFEGLRQVLNRLNSTGRKGVINLSLGGPVSSGVDTKYDDYFKQLSAVGGFSIVAAGNANVDACTYAPAKCTYAITVGAYSSSYKKSSFSNYGSCVTTWAPGESIPSSVWQSDAYNNKYALMSGTSMATPHITGLVANLLTINPSLTLDGIKSALAANSFSVASCTSGSVCNGAYYSCVSGSTAQSEEIAVPTTKSPTTTTKSPTTKSPTTTTKSPTTTTKSPTTTTKSPTTTTKSPTTTTKSPTTTTKSPTTTTKSPTTTTKSPTTTTKSPTTKSPTKYTTTKSAVSRAQTVDEPSITESTSEPTTTETRCCGGRRYCAVWDNDLATCETIKDCRIVTECN